jgi:NAD dependent epimerase/dehydratase family enzyme
MKAQNLLVTGGTGILGRRVTKRLGAEGREARVMSRSGRSGTVKGDLLTGEGIGMAVCGVDKIIHRGSEDKILAAWQAERFGRLMPNARVRMLEGWGHALEYDCPVRVNNQMEAFLDEQ